MLVGETRSVEREAQGWVPPVLQAEQKSVMWEGVIKRTVDSGRWRAAAGRW